MKFGITVTPRSSVTAETSGIMTAAETGAARAAGHSHKSRVGATNWGVSAPLPHAQPQACVPQVAQVPLQCSHFHTNVPRPPPASLRAAKLPKAPVSGRAQASSPCRSAVSRAGMLLAEAGASPQQRPQL